MYKNKQTPSPFFQPEPTLGYFKTELLKHISLLKMPKPIEVHDHECVRDCHIIERNHTLETMQAFIEGKEATNE